jgi:hypothetical protein
MMSLERLVRAFFGWISGHGFIISNPAVSFNISSTGGAL